MSGFDQAQGQPFEAVVLLDAGSGSGVDLPAREPLSKVKDMPPGSSSYVSAGPIIQGVYCKNGHFDDPEALFCAICGISMNQQTLVPRPGERPPLGVLLLDDGSVFQLDSDYVVGREPSLDGSVAAGKARPLRVADDSGIVSRVHARVHLDGWRVLVTDLGSANGTRVLLPGISPPISRSCRRCRSCWRPAARSILGGRGFRTSPIVAGDGGRRDDGDDGGADCGAAMTDADVQLLLFDLALIIVLARLLGALAKRIGQPPGARRDRGRHPARPDAIRGMKITRHAVPARR